MTIENHNYNYIENVNVEYTNSYRKYIENYSKHKYGYVWK